MRRGRKQAARVADAGLEGLRWRLLHVLAQRIPPYQRRQRALLMIEEAVRSLGIREDVCPACRGGGWEDEAGLVKCPICLGFKAVPGSLGRLVILVLERGGIQPAGRKPHDQRGGCGVRARAVRVELPGGASLREITE
jgi:hypothetical protein